MRKLATSGSTSHYCNVCALRSGRCRQAGNQVLDRFLQARNALPSEQLHARCALELRQFVLEREQALAAGDEVGGLLTRWHRWV